MSDDEMARFRADVERALREIDRLRAENAGLHGELERLRRRVAELEGKLEQARRAGKRQAAPFARHAPAAAPRRPGRRAGAEYGAHHRRSTPPRVDETIAVALPRTCPDCGGVVERTSTVEQVQEDVPRVAPTVTRFVIEVGRCRGCARRLQARHPRQTSNAVGAAGLQVGPRALALGTALHYEAGLSFGRSAAVLAQTTGIGVAPSTLARAAARLAGQCQGIDGALRAELRAAPVVTPDETGWHVGGHGAWLWTAATDTTTVYVLAPSRGTDVVDQLLGLDYAGIVVRDGWAPYRQLTQADHQTCLAHLLRRCAELRADSWGRGREIPNLVAGLLHDALALRDRREAGELAPTTVRRRRPALERRLDTLLARPAIRHPGNRRLLQHLQTERAALFTFLGQPGVPATNWRAEQAIRPAVVNRKTWGGNRTWAGAAVQQTLMTILRTARQRHRDGIGLLIAAGCAPGRASPALLTP